MTTTTATDPRIPIPAIPPLGWRREVPVYRISRDTLPAQRDRFRFESPVAQQGQAECWQFGEKIWPAGSVIATDQWPNPATMIPLTYAAREVMNFFTSATKSRLALSPIRDGQIRLDDGLSGALPRLTAIRPSNTQPQHGSDVRVTPVDAMATVPAA